MALKLLFADPDSEWIESAREYFTHQGYKIDDVGQGKDVQLALYNSKYFAVIISEEINNHPLMQVLRFIRSKHPTQKVIVCLKVDSTKEISDKYKKGGASDTIKKPFENSDLQSLLEGHQDITDIMSAQPKKNGVSKEEEVSLEDDKFTKIKIDELYSSKAVLFDIHIQLNSGRYIKILHRGDSFSQDRINHYKNEKKVTHLYILTSDRRKYIQFTNHLVSKTAKSNVLSGKVKVTLLKNTCEKFMEEVNTQGLKPLIVEQCKEICTNLSSVIDHQKDLHTILREFEEFDPNAMSHSFAVTLFSSSIIKQFEWQSQKTIETVAMACMFHDIGKLKLPSDIANLRPHQMTPEQLVEYKKHPELSVALIDGKHEITASTKQIIIQHHEYFRGGGFPTNLRGDRISTLANILCIANDFVHIVADNKIKPTEGLKFILTKPEIVQRYHSKIIENFIKIFVEPGKIISKQNLPTNSKVFKKSS